MLRNIEGNTPKRKKNLTGDWAANVELLKVVQEIVKEVPWARTGRNNSRRRTRAKSHPHPIVQHWAAYDVILMMLWEELTCDRRQRRWRRRQYSRKLTHFIKLHWPSAAAAASLIFRNIENTCHEVVISASTDTSGGGHGLVVARGWIRACFVYGGESCSRREAVGGGGGRRGGRAG